MNLCFPSLFLAERSDWRDESDLNPVSPVVLFCSDRSRSTQRLFEVAYRDESDTFPVSWPESPEADYFG